jgi:methyl-accepting chemotaxis protein
MTHPGATMTIGKKIGIGFALMMAANFGLAVYSLVTLKAVGDDFDNVSRMDTKKLDLVGGVSTTVAEMLSLERGVLNRVEMNDAATADIFHKAFGEQAQLAMRQVGELRPLLVTEAGKRNIEAISTAVSSWTPMDEDLWKAGRARQMQAVHKILDQRIRPAAAEAQRAANETKQIERERIAQAAERSHGAIVVARWIAAILAALGLAIGIAVMVVVHRSTGELKRMTRELNESTAQIAGASAQVAGSSQSLAQGASEQAASLEETSASAEEITSMTRKNADNSKVAAEVMATVDRHVKDGNRTIEEMVVSMQEINASSGKISKIIKVIDEIAFQTNILALNAAVEAARAGEAGMGFAVVADEVRNLAQRSAQAAKDTSGLIEESIAKSTQGGEKLQQVTSVIGSITESAAKVKMLVDEVNLGSQEQARGIEQISKAVSQMEQVTQGAAANAEQGASASEELSAHAQALSEIVLRLKDLAGSDEVPENIGGRAAVAATKISLGKRTPKAVAAVGVKDERKAFPLEDDFTEI